jgi:hypothetical protein
MVRTLLTICMILATNSLALAITFDHIEHNDYVEDSPCVTCHVEDTQSIVPGKQVCEECHDADFAKDVDYPSLTSHGPLWAFQHRAEAKGQAINCSQCHEQNYCLECHIDGRADEMNELGNNLANVHRSDFQVSHPVAARTDPQLCSSCHENSFCVDCHDSFNRNDLAFDSHRRSWSDLRVSPSGAEHRFYDESQCQGCHPNSVLPSHDWSGSHAREARKNLATCQACHPEGDVCITCHSARSGLGVNPHPKEWDDIKGRLERASGGKSCRRCH